MSMTRRSVFGATIAAGATLAATATPVHAAVSGGMLSASQLGVVTNGERDQSAELQYALDQAAARGGYLLLEPGLYIASGLRIRSSLNLIGAPGHSRIVQAGLAPVIIAEGTSGVRLEGLVIDGQLRTLPSDSAGLIEASRVRDLVIADCLVANSSAIGIRMTGSSGAIIGTTVENCINAGISVLDARGLRIDGNLITGMGDNGILVWQSAKQPDGTIVTGNRIEQISARSGGEGQNGNGINIYRAGNVMVANNQISDCAFTAVRNNSGSDVQIIANNCSRLGEVAIYSEFSVEGSIIANNMIDTSATGISITNFNEGGRLAVCQGNLVRNLNLRDHPVDKRGVGIAVEADTAVSGNVIENAPTAGIWLGWGRYFRNVSATGNVIRKCAIGISASVAAGAENGLIANNLISGADRGAILGMDHNTPATKDLAVAGVTPPETLSVSGNVVS